MPRPQKTYHRKECAFCKKKIGYVDFKDVPALQKYLTIWSKIRQSHDTGTCSRHQRALATAIKRARYMAFLPYTSK